VANTLISNATAIQVSGPDTSGEVEFVLLSKPDGMYVTVGSDHTDRKAETIGVSCRSSSAKSRSRSFTLDYSAMAYDETLVQRIRETLRRKRGVTERRMFGGVAFMLRGHMFLGTAKGSLMARVGPQNYERALAMEGVREMDFTGKPLRGYVFVEPQSLKSAADLNRWVEICADFVATLPAKTKKPTPRRTA
jgi:hypothetical protein